MERTTPSIQEKISAIQSALLRYSHNGKTVSLPVRIAIEKNDCLNCVITEDIPLQKLVNKTVTLIQKDYNNYLYIGGRIARTVLKNSLVLSIDITKACWFIRKSKGSVTWLQEKTIYLPQMNIAS